MTVVRLNARVFSDATGACTELPILLTEDGPVFPLLDYLLMRSRERSLSWMRKVVQAAQLMLRFIDANERHFPDFQHLLNAFRRRLYTGTIGDDGLDPSGLYWMPVRTRTANMLLTALGDYCTWFAEQRGGAHIIDAPISRYDERMRLGLRISVDRGPGVPDMVVVQAFTELPAGTPARDRQSAMIGAPMPGRPRGLLRRA